MKSPRIKVFGTVSLALYLLGLGCTVYGCWLLFHPLGWIVGGLLLFVIAMLIDREAKETNEPG